MMYIPDTFIAISLGVIFLTILISGIYLKRKGLDFFGTEPLHPFLYKTGKGFSFLVWISLFIVSIQPERIKGMPLLLFYPPELLKWLSAFFSVSAAIAIIVSFVSLGNSLMFGLPNGDVESFKRTGIYRFSRNPMYSAFALIDLAAALYIPSLFLLVPGIYAIYVHHRIILAEERYMKETWKDEYSAYIKAVRRYL
jgi:protein-S-isoprenylcysteine O-methyltransferase Ste14